MSYQVVSVAQYDLKRFRLFRGALERFVEKNATKYTRINPVNIALKYI